MTCARLSREPCLRRAGLIARDVCFFVSRSKHLGLLLAVVLVAAAGCAKRSLPEANTPVAQLYAKRCARCHEAYDPRSLTAEMWRLQVDAMMPKLAAAGQPLSDADKAAIIAYLTRNAGYQ